MVKDIRKLKDESELMSETAREQKQDEIDAKIKKLQNFDRDARDELKRERDKMARDILKEIDTTIQDLGKKEGYTVILNERMLLYYDQINSLTDRVLNSLNRRYKGSR
jgi:outer membrane protein